MVANVAVEAHFQSFARLREVMVVVGQIQQYLSHRFACFFSPLVAYGDRGWA
jgi:hypothetical protein